MAKERFYIPVNSKSVATALMIMLECVVLGFLIAVLVLSLGKQANGSENFQVHAPTPAIAAEIEQAAEKHRRELSVEWFGKPMPNWSAPCPITVEIKGGAGGSTSFEFYNGEVFNWNMKVQGTRERLLDSVIPHEVLHTVFASQFRQPLPRWLDEGACTVVEASVERNKHQHMLIQFLNNKRGIAFAKMVSAKEYPADMLPLYSQGHSAVSFLIEHTGKRAWVEFVRDGLTDDNWERAISEHYGYENLGKFQANWLGWVRAGSPARNVDAVASQTAYRVPFWNGREWVICRDGTCANPQPNQQAQQTIPTTRPLQDIPQSEPTRQDCSTQLQEIVNSLKQISQRIDEQNSQCQSLTVEINTIKQELTDVRAEIVAVSMGGGQGPPGKDGADGADGQTPEVDYDRIVSQVVTQLGVQIDQRFTSIENRIDNAAEPYRRLLYFTSDGHPDCVETDKIASQLRDSGYPITFIYLKPHNTEVGDVPRAYMLPEKTEVGGSQEVLQYLSTLDAK